MTSKHESEPAQVFEIESASRIWLKKYLDTPNKHLRLKALDCAITTIRLEGLRSKLNRRGHASNSLTDSLHNMENINEDRIHNNRSDPEKGVGFFKLYTASVFLIESYAERLRKSNMMSREDALTKTGNAFRRQKEIVLAELPKSASDPDLG